MWKSSLNHIHIWYCPSKVKIYNPNIKKSDPRTTTNFFIGHPSNFKRYRFYYHSHNPKIVESKNKKFLEYVEPRKNVNSQYVTFEKIPVHASLSSFKKD